MNEFLLLSALWFCFALLFKFIIILKRIFHITFSHGNHHETSLASHMMQWFCSLVFKLFLIPQKNIEEKKMIIKKYKAKIKLITKHKVDAKELL